jgi:hypothetical protein
VRSTALALLPDGPAGKEPSSRKHQHDAGAPEGLGSYGGYQDLLFAPDPAPEEQASRRQLLLQCCRLDTAAMVMVWWHWLGRSAPPS